MGKFLKTVTYQEVRNDDSSALLGQICGRASRAELFEGHARAADLRAAMFGDATLPWTDTQPGTAPDRASEALVPGPAGPQVPARQM